MSGGLWREPLSWWLAGLLLTKGTGEVVFVGSEGKRDVFKNFVSVGFVASTEAIRFVSVPRPCTEMDISSPGRRYIGGVRPMPTPAGYDVISISVSLDSLYCHKVEKSSRIEKGWGIA